MISYLFPFVIATILGFLAGMGVGGGSLLLLWLTQVIQMAQPQAKILNLLFYLPAAVVSTLFRLNTKSIDRRILLPALIAGCLSAAVLSMVSQTLNLSLAKKLLGALLIAVGIREVFYRPRNAK